MKAEALKTLEKMERLLEACEDAGATTDDVSELLDMLTDAIDILQEDSRTKPATLNDHTVAEVARVLRKAEWQVRDSADEAVEALCSRVVQSP